MSLAFRITVRLLIRPLITGAKYCDDSDERVCVLVFMDDVM